MRLVLIHGRSQQGRSADEVRAQWLAALRTGIEATPGLTLPDTLDVRVPFYGDLIEELVDRPPATDVVSRGSDGERPDRFEASLVLELAGRAGIDDHEIAEELHADAVEMGPENWPWVLAAARVLSKRLPWIGTTVLRELPDVHAYLTNPLVTDDVNEIVEREMDAGPAVVVGHSLGSVVAYWILRQTLTSLDVPLLVTVGSPLGIPTVKDSLPRPVDGPPSVAHWLNASDTRDPVALFPRLDRDNFRADIENLSDIHNTDEPHSIENYLGDRLVAKAIVKAINGSD